jgi:hypothetical protein
MSFIFCNIDYLMDKGGGVYRVWLGGPKGRDHWEDLHVGERITLRWTLGRLGSIG